jgi:O-antigen/teichoic acid export membrane protein
LAEVTAKGLARNSVFALAAQLWRIGSRFILTPIILAVIGLEGYGAWTLIFTICAYVNVVDANFGVAYTKFTAEYDAKGDYDQLARIIGSGMVLIGSIGAVGLFVVWLFRNPILAALGVPANMVVDAGHALLIVMVCVLMRMSVGCVFQVLTGLQRLDLRHKLGILASAVEFVVSLVLLYRHWGLLGLAMGHFCGQLISTVAAWWACHRLCPQLRISPFNCDRMGFRAMFSLGGRFQFLAVMQLLINQGTKLVMSGLLGVSMLAIAEIASKLLSLGVAIGGTVIAPVMPAFSNLRALGSKVREQALYERGSLIAAMVCIPTFAFLAIFADRLVPLWTGKDFPLSIWTVRVMFPVACLSMLTGMGTAALRGRGSIRLEFLYALIGVLLLVVLYPLGYWFWGYQGMIIAEVISGLVSTCWFLIAFARTEGLDLWHYARVTLLTPLLVLAPGIALITVLGLEIGVLPGLDGRRLLRLVDMAIWGAAYAVVVGLSAWFGLLSETDRRKLRAYLPGRRQSKNDAMLESTRVN